MNCVLVTDSGDALKLVIGTVTVVLELALVMVKTLDDGFDG